LAEVWWRYRETIRNGWLLYRADEPLRVQLTTTVPRVVLQVVFYTLLARTVLGAAGAAYAFVGCVAYAACMWTVVAVCDVPMNDSWSDSYYRLQTGVLGPATVYVCRALPYLVSGMVSSLLVLAIDGPVLGLTRQSLDLVPLLPLYALTAASSTALGLAVAALAVGRSADVLFGNLAAYLILALAGIVTPVPRAAHWLTYLADLLPVDHGVTAIRAVLADRPWTGEAALEALVGAAWLLCAVLVLRHRDRKTRVERKIRLSTILNGQTRA
jgi:ABC-type polysaccharide/polyol phosphate export permease